MSDIFRGYPQPPLPQEDLSNKAEIDRTLHFADAISDTLRLVDTKFDKNLNPYSSSVTSPETCKIRALALWPGRTIVPVIFIPGIMGSNLADVKTGKGVWLPPNGMRAKWKESGLREEQSAADREIQLNPESCIVMDRNDPIDLTFFNSLNTDEAIRRHWGELHAESYLGALQSLEKNLNYPYERESVMARVYGFGLPILNEIWRSAITPQVSEGKSPAPLWTPKSPLTEAELTSRLGKIYFPVYACGYNWLDSNIKSAELVAQRIEEIDARIRRHQAQKKVYFNDYPGKFILVTHSMGGLVARAAVRLPQLKDKILGVVHGVQPVTGAPVVYRRFKAGTEHEGFVEKRTAYVLGYGADNVTCVMAAAPGPLELLPTQYYGRDWLQFTDGNKTISLPSGDDPYKEIYEISNKQKWWGMVDPSLIDPANIFKDKDPSGDPFEDGFRVALKTAKKYHDTVKLTCHPNTYAYYGDDTKQRSFPRVIWRTTTSLDGFSHADILNAKLIKVDMQGETEVLIDGRKKVIFKPDYKPEGLAAAGDGTVPERSGAAVARLEGIRDVFKLKGFDHQMSYENPIAQHTVFYALGKMMQEIKVSEEAACKF